MVVVIFMCSIFLKVNEKRFSCCVILKAIVGCY